MNKRSNQLNKLSFLFKKGKQICMKKRRRNKYQKHIDPFLSQEKKINAKKRIHPFQTCKTISQEKKTHPITHTLTYTPYTPNSVQEHKFIYFLVYLFFFF